MSYASVIVATIKSKEQVVKITKKKSHFKKQGTFQNGIH